MAGKIYNSKDEAVRATTRSEGSGSTAKKVAAAAPELEPKRLLIPVTGHDGENYGYSFWCPACRELHRFYVRGSVTWNFNGDLENPSFNPSLRIISGSGAGCHLFVAGAKIQYCGDCPHEFKGREVPMVPIRIHPETGAIEL